MVRLCSNHFFSDYAMSELNLKLVASEPEEKVEIVYFDDSYPRFGLSFYGLVAQAIMDRRVESYKTIKLFPKGDKKEFVLHTGDPFLTGKWIWVATSTQISSYDFHAHQQMKWNIRRLKGLEYDENGLISFKNTKIRVKDPEGLREPFMPCIGLGANQVIGMVKVESHVHTGGVHALRFGEVKYIELPVDAMTSDGLWQVNQEFVHTIEVADRCPDFLLYDNPMIDKATYTWILAELISRMIEQGLQVNKVLPVQAVVAPFQAVQQNRGIPTNEINRVISRLLKYWAGAAMLRKYEQALNDAGYALLEQ